MSDLEKLKRQIMNIIRDDNYDLSDLKEVLTPICTYVNNPLFQSNVDDIVKILIKDRDGNNKFTIDDLALLKNDILGITSLITAILLIISAIPELKLKYEAGLTEEIIFKILAYIFLVIIPKQTGHPWNLEEKEAVLNLSLLIYQLIKSSQITKDLINKIKEWFKSKGWCTCVSGTKQEQNAAVLEKRLPQIKLELTHAMNNIREKSEMKAEINGLKRKIEKNESKK